MRKFIAGVVLGIFSVVLVAHMTQGQAAGTAQVKNPQVKQGDNVTMDVLIDKTSNLYGTIIVKAFPEGMTNGGVTLGCGLNSGQVTCAASARVPLDAKVGKWVIAEITFTPLSGEPKVLSKHGDSSFQVVAHGNIILPDSATVSDIK